MARFSADYRFDMTGGEGGGEVLPGRLLYYGSSEFIVGNGEYKTVYEGRFSYPGGEWRGTVEWVSLFNDDGRLWSLNDASIATRYFTVGHAMVDMFRRALDGDDRVDGSPGSDRLFGFDGDDRVSGKLGNDALYGGAGNDTVIGGTGADKVTGGDGRDRIEGGNGNDRLFGGSSSDVFAFDASDGRDRIYDFRNGADRIEITAGAERFSELDVRQSGDDARVAFAHTIIFLEDTALRQIGAEDFIF